jgi:hypothetical protein
MASLVKSIDRIAFGNEVVNQVHVATAVLG